ncbi:hypothetical protein LY76DRAFT_130816 [Colletotrichum caudatum]|nr:hypothetical protein LY76DRAFT_130816 [Colletotrichum caudatum]
MMGIDRPGGAQRAKRGGRMAAGVGYTLALSLSLCVCVVHNPTYPLQTFLPQPEIHVVGFSFLSPFFFLFRICRGPWESSALVFSKKEKRVANTRGKKNHMAIISKRPRDKPNKKSQDARTRGGDARQGERWRGEGSLVR